MTKYELHVQRWRSGCGSDQCQGAKHVCLGRGSAIPAHVLFIGEAPGESENILGRPFAGPAGLLLDEIISEAFAGWCICRHCNKSFNGLRCSHCLKPQALNVVSYAITNLVGCIPRAQEGGKAGQPDHEQIVACSKRLKDFAAIVQPWLIVTVGKLSEEYVNSGYKHGINIPCTRKVHIDHPAYILRKNIAQQSLLRQKCIVTLSNAIEEL